MAKHLGLNTKSHSDISVDSPCVRNCCLDQDEVCLGCFRSLAEILQWNRATGAEKQAILAQSLLRKASRQTKFG
ncbi:hypothetical protein MED121_13075 [Marinomonas sp. MED121]|uniref:DUF1289 domain-containing protein n=1 Tax=Marinomonas sp. MED121 TaxID=314277 RepID=UPI000068FFC4|nr:DUF1289 domain-containing protein [Marinomonas sp. MED121]EAQ66861.1 hypothetical protein MED121_13075 [Marinomonas sp. MED121]